MLIQLSEEQTQELQHAVNDRVDVLKKLRKKTDDAGLATREIDMHLAILRGGEGYETGLIHMLDDQIDGFNGPPRDGENLTLDEALEGVEAEAARLRRREILRALDALLPNFGAPLMPPIEDDAALLRMVADEWDEVVFEREDMDDTPGAYLHLTEDGREVWCFVRGGDAPAFFYDVQLGEGFNSFEALPTLAGDELVATVLRLMDFAPDVVADQDEAEPKAPVVEEVEEETVEAEQPGEPAGVA